MGYFTRAGMAVAGKKKNEDMSFQYQIADYVFIKVTFQDIVQKNF